MKLTGVQTEIRLLLERLVCFCEEVRARLLRYVSAAATAEADPADAFHTRGFPLLQSGMS